MGFVSHVGGMAEWLKAAVLKTVEGNTSVGSNPTPSAINNFTLPKLFVKLLEFVSKPQIAAKDPAALKRYAGKCKAPYRAVR